MHSSNYKSISNLRDEDYSHCCIEKYGTARKWLKDDFNFEKIDYKDISVFNKIKISQIEGIPFGNTNLTEPKESEQFSILANGQFYKMKKYTVSTDQLNHGDLIHYIITIEDQMILCNTSDNQKILESLTKREKEVLSYFAQGHSMTRIAKLLYLSPHTIDSHRINLCKKLKVKRVTELAIWAYKLGLASPAASVSNAS